MEHEPLHVYFNNLTFEKSLEGWVDNIKVSLLFEGRSKDDPVIKLRSENKENEDFDIRLKELLKKLTEEKGWL